MEGMAAHAPAWAAALEASAYGAAMRGSYFLYPLANLMHLFGLVLLVGSAILMDLRLLGVGRSVPLAPVVRLLGVSAAAGLVIMACSGFSMFAADAGPLSMNPVFQIKMLVLATAVLNALLFRALWQRRLAGWASSAPGVPKVQAALSLALWLAVGTCGRLIAYF
jgi:hypothetical protein